MEEEIGYGLHKEGIHGTLPHEDIESYLQGKDVIFDAEHQNPNEDAPLLNSYFQNIKLVDHLAIHEDGEGKEESNSDKDTEEYNPFGQMASKMLDLTGDGGVLKKIIKEGTGDYPIEGALVRFHYDAFVEFADEPFDSSYLRGKSYRVRLGYEGLLLGMDVALRQMKKFEKAEFLFKPKYAFGKQGCPPRIPPGKLSQLNKLSSLANLERLTPEERKELTLQTFIEVAHNEQLQGNDYYQNGLYGSAILRYQHGIQVLEEAHVINEEEEKEQQSMFLKLYLNIAQCNLKLGEGGRAITACNKALAIDPKNVKAKFRYAVALIALNSDLNKAKRLLKEVQKQMPNSSEVTAAMERLEDKAKQNHFLESDLCKKMFRKKSDGKSHQANLPKEPQKPDVSKEFKKLVHRKLDDFVLSAAMQLDFPMNLTKEETAYLSTQTRNRGLTIASGEEGSFSLVILKTD